jgi:hypothetical protein
MVDATGTQASLPSLEGGAAAASVDRVVHVCEVRKGYSRPETGKV